MNITEYTNTFGNENTIEDSPLNAVDSLILSQLSYLKFEGLVPEIGTESEGVSLEELSQNKDINNLYRDERYAEINKGLFDAASSSKRFREMKLRDFIDIVDPDNEIQFSAVTAVFPNEITYVIYRGTDDNLVGWQEDLNMIYQTPVPAQSKALWYLNTVSGRIKGDFYVGGHSKGGNLAVYASMEANADIQDRIIKIYSHDGPGFKRELLESSGFERIKTKITKQVPKSSIFGMLLTTQEEYEVIISKHHAVSQHNPFNWIVEGTDFKKADSVDSLYMLQRKIFNMWANQLTDEQARTLSEELFGMFDKAGLSNINDFQGDITTIHNNYKALVDAKESIPEETKEELDGILKLYKDIFTEVTSKKAKSSVKEAKENAIAARENALENMQTVMDNVKVNVEKAKNNVDKSKKSKYAVISKKE